MVASIIIPGRAYKQPSGRVKIARDWEGLVLSAYTAGAYNAVNSSFSASDNVSSSPGALGLQDLPSGSASYINETAAPEDDFILLCAFNVGGTSSVRQLCAADYGSSGNRIFQFRTSGTAVQFIRFNTANAAFTQSGGNVTDIENKAGFVSALAWSRGNDYGFVIDSLEASGVMTGTPKTWGAVTYANWYSRQSGATTYSELSTHQGGLRAVIKGAGDETLRRSLQSNPFQLFDGEPTRIYFLPPAVATPTLSFPGVIDIGTTSARPQVTLTY